MIVFLLCVCVCCVWLLVNQLRRDHFLYRGGHSCLNVNWSPFNFAHSKAFSTLLLNWISARLSWGRAFWVVWAQGRKIAREIAKPRFREIQMRIGRNRDGNCKRSTQEMDKLKPNSSCLRSIFEEKSCPFGSMIFTWKTIFFFSYQNQEMFFYNPMLNSACKSWWIFVIFSVCIRAALDF